MITASSTTLSKPRACGVSTVFCAISTVGASQSHTRNVRRSVVELNLRRTHTNILDCKSLACMFTGVDRKNLHGLQHNLHPMCTSLEGTTGMSITLSMKKKRSDAIHLSLLSTGMSTTLSMNWTVPGCAPQPQAQPRTPHSPLPRPSPHLPGTHFGAPGRRPRQECS